MVETLFLNRLLVIFVGSIFFALLAASVTIVLTKRDRLAWPIRLYMFAFRISSWDFAREYFARRASIPRREQFWISFFVWFLPVFFALILIVR